MKLPIPLDYYVVELLRFAEDVFCNINQETVQLFVLQIEDIWCSVALAVDYTVKIWYSFEIFYQLIWGQRCIVIGAVLRKRVVD